MVRNTLQKHAHILIVSPFSNNKTFQKEFGSSKINFFNLTPSEQLRQPFISLYTVSEILRRYGYWTRYRNQGMGYYFLTRFLSLGEDGNDVELPLLKQFIHNILGVIGIWRKSWRFIDKIIGPSIFEVSDLSAIAHGFEKVTLIQSASWGFQDRLLGWMARKHKWRTVMLPYTTDQLLIQGHLISDFDSVCVQGQLEYDYALTFHNVPECRIKKLGSPWARYTEELQQRIKVTKERKKIIGYAGVSSMYFPVESEFYGLELLLAAIDAKEIDNTEIVYRPIGATKEIRKNIEARFSGKSNLSIQFSQKACYGMDTYDFSNNYEKALEEFVQQISRYDLLVMANFTSLFIDLAYIGVPSISYLFDSTGVLLKRKLEKRLNNYGRMSLHPDLPVVLNENQLIPEVKKLLNAPEKAQKQVEKTVQQWDYKNANFNKILEEAIGI